MFSLFQWECVIFSLGSLYFLSILFYLYSILSLLYFIFNPFYLRHFISILFCFYSVIDAIAVSSMISFLDLCKERSSDFCSWSPYFPADRAGWQSTTNGAPINCQHRTYYIRPMPVLRLSSPSLLWTGSTLALTYRWQLLGCLTTSRVENK